MRSLAWTLILAVTKMSVEDMDYRENATQDLPPDTGASNQGAKGSGVCDAGCTSLQNNDNEGGDAVSRLSSQGCEKPRHHPLRAPPRGSKSRPERQLNEAIGGDAGRAGTAHPHRTDAPVYHEKGRRMDQGGKRSARSACGVRPSTQHEETDKAPLVRTDATAGRAGQTP